MGDFSRNIIEKAEQLNLRIEENRKRIVLYSVLSVEKEYPIVFSMQTTINHCLQCGNYWRACKYILATEKLLDDFEKNASLLTHKVTKFFVKD